jgi:alpha-galactosidase
LLDLTGKHVRERSPQRLPFGFGSWAREQRRGRPGHDSPLMLVAGTAGFGFRHGEVWAVHLAWSGDSTTYAERLPEGWSAIGGGELLQAGELLLEPGEQYAAPWLYAAYSDHGLDGITNSLVQDLRDRPHHPATPRPVVLNTWEAVYFNHNVDRLTELADVAAHVGVERFVLDDGWFGSRRTDRAGLGDWYVSPDVWPEGLKPLVDHVTKLGMQFGLWVEPEMVNPDSDLARAHPDWILAAPGRVPPPARSQQVLDVANPLVSKYLLERLDALLSEYDIGYLKWDHNRDVVDPATSAYSPRRPGVHAQTVALYALIDELRRRHPSLEIESCAGGGGRVDLEILQRTERIWGSDCNDPLERQHIQRWTGLLTPPELIGAHVGPPRAHTTGRFASLSFRAGTALFGHFGIEWDLTTTSTAERAQLAAWISTYQKFRSLLHTGTIVRADSVDHAMLVHGVVSEDAHEALFAVVQLGTTAWATPPPIRLPGLDGNCEYRVQPVLPGNKPMMMGVQPPNWWLQHSVTLPGSALGDIGLPGLLLAPEQLALLHISAMP